MSGYASIVDARLLDVAGMSRAFFGMAAVVDRAGHLLRAALSDALPSSGSAT